MYFDVEQRNYSSLKGMSIVIKISERINQQYKEH